MSTSASRHTKRRGCGPWGLRRDLRHRLIAQENHPHYVGNNNESLRLDQVIKANPPEGGMAVYLAAMDANNLTPAKRNNK